MKKYYIIPLICLIALLSACADQLDQYSYGAIPPDAVTEKDLPALRNGMYNSVQNNPGDLAYISFDILGGVLQTGTGTYKELINSTLSPLNSTVVATWNGYYKALYQVNNIIAITDRFPNADISTLARGEAHFFRAYIYYSLASKWGGVPILRENTQEKLPRNPINEVWSFIEEDLDNAAARLGSASSYYYVSKDAVTALRARVKLAQGENSEAAQLAESLITSGSYKLDTFEKIFRKSMNTEIIFAFENITEESSINISDLFYTYAHPNKGQGAYRLTPEMLAMFTPEDKRTDISVINISGTNCVNKYPSGQTGSDPLIISRIAEMYLISAEAQGRTNGVSRLNELRTFRGLAAVYPSTDDAYMNAILDERKRELMGENFIYYDLVRTKKATAQIGLLTHQHLFPIPGRELLLNTNLEPNPGY